jgi:hypothetical protein
MRQDEEEQQKINPNQAPEESTGDIRDRLKRRTLRCFGHDDSVSPPHCGQV